MIGQIAVKFANQHGRKVDMSKLNHLENIRFKCYQKMTDHWNNVMTPLMDELKKSGGVGSCEYRGGIVDVYVNDGVSWVWNDESEPTSHTAKLIMENLDRSKTLSGRMSMFQVEMINVLNLEYLKREKPVIKLNINERIYWMKLVRDRHSSKYELVGAPEDIVEISY